MWSQSAIALLGPAKKQESLLFSGKLTVAFRSRCIAYHLFLPSIPRGVGAGLCSTVEAELYRLPLRLSRYKCGLSRLNWPCRTRRGEFSR